MTTEARIDAVFSVACGCAAMRQMERANAGKVLREAIFFFWELKNGPKFGDHRRRSVYFRNEPGNRIYDHAIPLKILTERLFASPLTISNLQEVLDLVEGVLITHPEHRRLKALGLESAMPSDWDGADKWARYRAAGIDLLPGGVS